jgi:predicted ATPase/class 3 adenylate cyclase
MALQPKVFSVLHYLLTHRDRVIAKRELTEQIWPDQFISDATLEGVIKSVRQAVGDTGRRQWCIQTRRGQGYRFVAALVKPDVIRSSDTEALPAMRPERDALRRQLTVVCCDLVEASQLARQLPPEDFRDVIQAYQAMCTDIIQRFEGSIARDYGVEMMLHFGSPLAQEDASCRAIHTALAIVEALGLLNQRLQLMPPHRLSVRLGIHTGMAVVEEPSEGGSRTQLAFGETPYVARELQALAEPDTVVISAATARLVHGLFVCRDLEATPNSDGPRSQGLVQVLRASEAQSRFEVAQRQGLRPLVGREQELGQLWQCWEKIRHGRGYSVLICGEAGIGKSRLVEALREQVEHAEAASEAAPTWRVFRCGSSTQQSTFHPVIVHLQQCLQWRRYDSPAIKLATLEEMLQSSALPLAEAVPLFAALLSVPLDGRYEPLALAPERQRQKTLEAIMTWLLQESARCPSLIVWEDLHWADPSTLELISLLIDQIPMAPVLILLTCRPTFQPSWSPRSYVVPLMLNRLEPDQVGQMVANELAGYRLSAEVLQEIITKSDGIPLFVEELLMRLTSSGLIHSESAPTVLPEGDLPLAIPSTLHDLLMTRLDPLNPGREMAQLGAMLGREFDYEVLLAVTKHDEPTVRQGLAQLVDAELLYQRGLPPRASYLFKHALIQDVAYQSLLDSARLQHHRQIAQTLEEQFPDVRETQPELLAHHYTAGECAAQAVYYWLQAGQYARERSAYAEAINHLTRGLTLLETLPTSHERVQHELALQLTLGPVFMTMKGYGAPEVKRVYARARELCRQVGDHSRYFSALWGLYSFYLVRAEYPTAYEFAQQLHTIAQHEDDSEHRLRAHLALGETLFWRGEMEAAQPNFEQSLHLYNDHQTRPSTVLYEQDPAVLCRTYSALAMWWGGQADQALQAMQAATLHARQLAHPPSLAWVLLCLTLLHSLRREAAAVQAGAVEVITLAAEAGFPFWVAVGTILSGWARAEQGEPEEGIQLIRQGLDAYQAIGAELGRPYFLALLAEAYGKIGAVDAGLEILAQALEASTSSGEGISWPELYRLRGELLLTQNDLTPRNTGDRPLVREAEASLCQAAEIAARQGAKSWQLRAVLSLSRLWRLQGKSDLARRQLADVYNGFTEGFDTADLKDAKTLLDALSPFTLVV